MRWNRREFLGLAISGAAGELVAWTVPVSVTPISIYPPLSTPPSLRMNALYAISNGKEPGRLKIARSNSDKTLIEGWLLSAGVFWWCSTPGNEILWGDGLVNLSDVDLNVRLFLTDGKHRWLVSGNGDWPVLTMERIENE